MQNRIKRTILHKAQARSTQATFNDQLFYHLAFINEQDKQSSDSWLRQFQGWRLLESLREKSCLSYIMRGIRCLGSWGMPLLKHVLFPSRQPRHVNASIHGKCNLNIHAPWSPGPSACLISGMKSTLAAVPNRAWREVLWRFIRRLKPVPETFLPWSYTAWNYRRLLCGGTGSALISDKYMAVGRLVHQTK